MNKELIANNYLVIRSFIDKDRAQALAEEFEQAVAIPQLLGDIQVKDAYCTRNFVPFLRLLIEKNAELSELTNLRLLPTYNYARYYLKNADLPVHKDRPACQISVTVTLRKTDDWKIHIKTPTGETRSVELEQGDAMLYLGMEAEHWRDKYTGNAHSQLFIHYVDSDGPYAPEFFDRFMEHRLLSDMDGLLC